MLKGARRPEMMTESLPQTRHRFGTTPRSVKRFPLFWDESLIAGLPCRECGSLARRMWN